MDDESDTTIDSDEEFENDNFSEPVIRKPVNNISQNATPIDAVFFAARKLLQTIYMAWFRMSGMAWNIFVINW